jgi:peptidoglycan/xylan/chitin deacetylase (PgdA/CDA1 family)
MGGPDHARGRAGDLRKDHNITTPYPRKIKLADQLLRFESSGVLGPPLCQERTGTMRGLLRAICGLTLFGATVAWAAECPGNPDALGTSRTIVVDPAEHARIGSMQYDESLPLEDHEVVITFDDGPLPPHSNRALEILAHECVKATYFIVGKMARSFPDVVRRIRDAGHTIGTHSNSHPLTVQKMSVEKAQLEIGDGIAAVSWALGGGAEPAPFFRIPGLLRTDGVERYLASRHIQVWSADFLADDWTRIGPAQVYSRALQRIEANHKGILLLHDIHARTVEALPYLLRELKRRGYRIVHVVPATPDQPKTATDPRLWMMHARQIRPRRPILVGAAPELPAPSPASFGFDAGFDLQSIIHGLARGARATRARAQVRLPPVSLWPRGIEGVPNVPPLLRSPQLPAPSPQNLGYPDAPRPWLERKASLDVVPETADTENDIRRLLESLPPEETPTPSVPSVPPLPPRGPISTTIMPRGAYP